MKIVSLIYLYLNLNTTCEVLCNIKRQSRDQKVELMLEIYKVRKCYKALSLQKEKVLNKIM